MDDPTPDRCGHAWDPEWLDHPRHQHCCFRETWGDRDACFWHATGEKSLAAFGGPDGVDPVADLGRETPANRRLNARAPPPGDPTPRAPDGTPLSGSVPDARPGEAGEAGRDDPGQSPYPAELLCDARLSGVELGDALSFENCWFNGGDLSGANLAGAAMAGADCERVTLSGAVLWETDLSGADLRGDCSGAYLREADLSGADVGAADMRYAALPDPDLSGADLQLANCEGTRFRDADLSDATLSGADLTGADCERATLERATLFGTTLVDATLYGAALGDAQVDDRTAFFAGSDRLCAYHPDNDRPAADRSAGRESIGDGIAVGEGADDLTRAAWTYRAIETLARENSFPGLQARMFVARKRMTTRAHRREHGALSREYLFARLSGVVIKHGEGYLRVPGWSAAVVVAFALLYPLGGWIRSVPPTGAPGEPLTWSRVAESPALLLESLYYSTLTFANLGLGDYRPVGAGGQVLSVVEGSIGVVLLALLVFVVGRRASR
jgi:uncharacterized protein YjbI with pentapeptide repeats